MVDHKNGNRSTFTPSDLAISLLSAPPYARQQRSRKDFVCGQDFSLTRTAVHHTLTFFRIELSNMSDHKVKDLVKRAKDLTTMPDQTAEGFIWQAKEKTVRATGIIRDAIAVKQRLDTCKSIVEMISDPELKDAILFCAGLSAKAQNHLSPSQLESIAKRTLDEISSQGSNLGTEVLYRYLLTAGDSLGGTMRNLVGAYAQKMFACLIQQKLTAASVPFNLIESNAEKVQAIHWAGRVLVFDRTPKFLKKNVDVILLKGDFTDYETHDLLNVRESYLAVGELKGGIDPAGADEHWKTARTALQRVRDAFKGAACPKLFFVGSAIEDAMAREIFKDLSKGKLEFAANLTRSTQTSALVDWLISL
jgi:hypothetical protein